MNDKIYLLIELNEYLTYQEGYSIIKGYKNMKKAYIAIKKRTTTEMSYTTMTRNITANGDHIEGKFAIKRIYTE